MESTWGGEVEVKTQFEMVAGGATGYKSVGTFSVEILPDRPDSLLRIVCDEPVVKYLEYTPGPAYPALEILLPKPTEQSR